MLRWLAARKPSPPSGAAQDITDDPLAALDAFCPKDRIYSVSRVNPLFLDINNHIPKIQTTRQNSPASREKSTSSGYGSSFEHTYQDQFKSIGQVGGVLEQNPAYVKSIRIASRTAKPYQKNVPSPSSSSGGGTLTTIPEGRVDLPVPKPIWPDKILLDHYDSLVDDALLLYTSFNYKPENVKSLENYIDLSVRDLLLELLNSINETLEGHNGTPPEDMLKIINEKIRLKLDVLRNSTEEEMRRLCVNLSQCAKKNSVLRALSNSSSSGNSTNSSRERTSSSETEDLYQVPSGSSSSGFSDSLKDQPSVQPVFVHEDLVNVSNVLRNAMIYGTLYRTKATNEALLGKQRKATTVPKKSLLRAVNDNKPSVWEQYYGVKAVEEGGGKFVGKPTDVPLFPGGRPEADFTLDLPRSEHLMKRMKEDKKWRCRCRLLTSFLGLVFFLLSVMAVSLMLTRGKRMFGSMV